MNRNDLSSFTDYLDYATTCANVVLHVIGAILGVRHIIQVMVASYMRKKERKEL